MKVIPTWKNKTAKAEYLTSLINEASITPKEYDMKNDHIIGEHISHPKFGLGFIEKAIGHNKIVVFFEQFEKVLLNNWTRS